MTGDPKRRRVTADLCRPALPSAATALLSAVTALLVAGFAVLPAGTAEAGTARHEIITPLDGKSGDSQLSGWLNQTSLATDEQRVVPLGKSFELILELSEPGHLLLLHVDGQGQGRVVTAGDQTPSMAVAADSEMPVPGGGVDWKAELPFGPQDLFIIRSASPLSWTDVGLDEAITADIRLAPDEALWTTTALATLIDGGRASLLGHERFEVGPRARTRSLTGDQAGYTAEDIVNYFQTPRMRGGTRSARSTQMRGLDMPVSFTSGSADLTATGKAELDRWAEAFTEDALEEARFEIQGHTDDTGGHSENIRMSIRRAESVFEYMVQERGVSPDRFVLKAMGETSPKVLDTTDWARQQNRRITFARVE